MSKDDDRALRLAAQLYYAQGWGPLTLFEVAGLEIFRPVLPVSAVKKAITASKRAVCSQHLKGDVRPQEILEMLTFSLFTPS
ncbi:MAG: hypothetical protein G3M78_02625 [Candidatus Nitrohelix vancouverensis]|uniref:Uncharacterized protein n=1 Tax=Candidatus Nitrohelix vancouverensis TaxID=2705534 RepID=A0A7T0C0L1_9BACT|nr:MAG: hypothetical protein G3M78_02625 [Candidatus Nitrohelix vancouverensis]